MKRIIFTAVLLICMLFSVASATTAPRYFSKAYYNVDTISTITDIPHQGAPITSTYPGNYAVKDGQFLFQDGKGCVVFFLTANDRLFYERYDENFSLVETKQISMPLPTLGGIHRGEDGHYYIVYGESNASETREKEVMRVVRYDNNLQTMGYVSIPAKTINTQYPFSFGGMDMADNGNILVVHTARVRFKSDDGLNHQSNVTLKISIPNMKLIEASKPFPWNHVSHSFAQFVRFDGDDIIYVDHGDAYPRAIVLQRESDGEEVNILTMNGAIGDNYTGAMTGGFEVSSNKYIVAGNSIPLASSSTGSKRNIFVATVDKNFTWSDKPKMLWLTNYSQSGSVHANVPQLIKLSDDKFVVAWESIESGRCIGVYFQLLDENLNKIGETHTVQGSGIRLPSTLRILSKGDRLLWFLTSRGASPYSNQYLAQNLYFYSLDTAKKPDNALITLEQNELYMEPGNSYALSALSDLLSTKLTWRSSDTSVVAVSNDMLSAKKIGRATITAQHADSGASAKLTVIVRRASDIATEQRGNSIGNHATGGSMAFDSEYVYFQSARQSLACVPLKGGRATEIFAPGIGYMSLNIFEKKIIAFSQSGYYPVMHQSSINATSPDSFALSFNKSISDVQIVGGYAYFIDENAKLKRAVVGETRTSQALVGRNVRSYLATKNRLYYATTGGGVYRADLNGKNSKKIGNDRAQSINVVDGKVYYVTPSGNIRRIVVMDLNGKGRKVLTEYASNGEKDCINVHEGYIYFAHGGSKKGISRIAVGGGKVKLIVGSEVYGIDSSIAANGNYIYFTARNNASLYHVRGGGGGLKKMY